MVFRVLKLGLVEEIYQWECGFGWVLLPDLFVELR